MDIMLPIVGKNIILMLLLSEAWFGNRALAENDADSGYFTDRLNDIIKRYDRKVRPSTGGPPTNVQIEMKIVSFGPIDEAKQEYTLDIFFRQWWNDPLLRGAVNTTLTMAINPGSLFWIPDTYFVNAKDPTFQYVTKEAMRVVLQPNGDLYYSSRIMFEATCPMDFTYYPFDDQTCPLTIESYSYTTEDVFYTWYASTGKLRKTKGVEWVAALGPTFTLKDVTSLQKQISNNSKGAFSSLRVNFHLERRNGFYFWNTFLPGGILVVMTWINFWIPPWAYPARVTVCVTSFLSTLVVMSTASNQLGRVSYVKAIDYFLFGNVVFVLTSLLEYCMVLHSWFDFKFDCFKKLRKKNKDQIKGPSLGKINEEIEYENGSAASVIRLEERSRHSSFIGLSERLRHEDITRKGSAFSIGEESTSNSMNGTRHAPRRRKSSTFLAMKQFQEKYDLSPEESKQPHPLDNLSRYIFPLSYGIFVLCYCAVLKLL